MQIIGAAGCRLPRRLSNEREAGNNPPPPSFPPSPHTHPFVTQCTPAPSRPHLIVVCDGQPRIFGLRARYPLASSTRGTALHFVSLLLASFPPRYFSTSLFSATRHLSRPRRVRDARRLLVVLVDSRIFCESKSGFASLSRCRAAEPRRAAGAVRGLGKDQVRPLIRTCGSPSGPGAHWSLELVPRGGEASTPGDGVAEE